MTWFWISITAYILLAFASLTDKFLLNKIRNNWSYTVFVCLAGGIVILAAPWFLRWLGVKEFLLVIISGITFILALYSLYVALSRGEASRTLVMVGSFTPVFSLLFSLLSGENFSGQQIMGMIFLITGALAIAFIKPEHNFFHRLFGNSQNKVGRQAFWFSLASALFYSFYFLGSKYVYDSVGFINGFIWVRVVIVVIIVSSFVFPSLRHLVLSDVKNMRRGNGNNPFLMIFNQVVGASGFILQNFAISLGSVAVINSLQGFQYGFLVVSTSILSRFFPKIFPRSHSFVSWLKKGAAIVLVSVGLYLIY
jgi:drug/metabolite transporter (DMT)-like permease